MSEDNGINVLSLFDGMSCGQIALQRAGIKVNQYFASEIDKHAIKVTMANFPDTIQLGDVTKVSSKDLPKIDLLIGGSPCQGFSFAGKGLNFEDERSKLFFEFVRLKEECNPTYFLLENVQMKYEHELVISKYLNVNPIEINSALLSAQNRVRLYWTNINEKSYGLFGDKKPDIPQPKDKGILLKDILEESVSDKYTLSEKAMNWVNNMREEIKEYDLLDFSHKNEGVRVYEGKCPTLNQRDYKEPRCVAMRGRGENNAQRLEINKTGKTNSLTSVQKDNLCLFVGAIHKHNRGNGTLSRDYSQQHRIYSEEGKAATIMTSEGFNSKYLVGDYIRKLTPTECERLQTVPDDYTKEASDTQRYRMLGNGWTVDVIVHILSFMK